MVLSLTTTVVSVVLIGLNIGLIPDWHAVALHGRRQLCEAIAANASGVVRQRDIDRMQAILELLVQRNPDICSAALRRADGSLVAQVGGHSTLWETRLQGRASATHISVPIQAQHGDWGTVELVFTPLAAPGWRGYLLEPQLLFISFVGGVTFLLVNLYLRKTLRQLDPSKVVPGRVRTALDTLAEGLLVLDQQYRIMLANQSFADIVGEAPKRLLGRLVSELPWSDPPDAELGGYPWECALRTMTPLAGRMLRLADRSGKSRTFMVNCTPIPGNEGEIRGVLTSLEDVTRLEETQLELSRSKEAADAANRAKSDFLARMSHEIRTPMNAILGFTEVLQRGFENSVMERQEYLDTIYASGQHLLNLINDILDLSKVEAGKMEVEKIRCSPLQLIHEAVSTLRGQAEKKGIRLTYEAPAGLPETITTDSVRFRQVLTNLVGNAIKFTSQGSVRVVARLVEDRQESRLAVDVIDTGIGMSAETLQQIFNPFSQADISVTRRFGGTGLGLTISRTFAEMLGGALTVESTPGVGSTFTFTVDPGPLDGVRLVTVDDLKEQLTATDTARTIRRQLPAVRILVADDGDSNRKLISLVLTGAGATVYLACNGEEAVTALETLQVDLVLMDMQMPVMDGFTATRILRERQFTAPIVALTADAMKGSEEKCLAAGCSSFLTKPIDIDKLIQSVASVLCDAGYDLSVPTHDPEPSVRRPIPVGRRIHSTLPTEDPEFCAIIAEFIDRLALKRAAMREAFAAGDHEQLALLAHWLKGAGGTAGFQVLTEQAKELERLSRGRADDQQLAAALADLETLAEALVVPVAPPAPVETAN